MEMPMLQSEKTADLVVFELPVYWSPSLQYYKANSSPKVLNLGDNRFTGQIPQQIGHLKALTALNLSFNNLYGEVPQSISNLTNLQVLDLSNNHLTGAIPTALEDLNFLSEFNISNNDLDGPVPTGGQFSTYPDSSFIGNPKMCGPMLIHQHCNSAEVDPAPIVPIEASGGHIVFAIAFSVFFGVGVLYDQIVLSRCFG
ncbi:hypothetical protein QOZ80_2AG0101950 [Eleusine coracana subsp. coracana]|nr:hypothetical protein QOZ80_2AG0101950 [Eleusine coracana subsp. coracana]